MSLDIGYRNQSCFCLTILIQLNLADVFSVCNVPNPHLWTKGVRKTSGLSRATRSGLDASRFPWATH